MRSASPNHLLPLLSSGPVPQPDPNTPKPEGRQIIPVKGEPLGVVSNWPPALQAALARWGATQAKSPALTALDVTGKPLYTVTYGQQHSQKHLYSPELTFMSLCLLNVNVRCISCI